MSLVVYYLPNVPDNFSTTRYNHALAVADVSDEAVLVTFPDAPPDAITEAYDRVHILDDGSVLNRALQARSIAESLLSPDRADHVFLTTFHYAPALAGVLTDATWVLDVYDDPHQYRYSNPRSIHSLSVYGLGTILDRADRSIHTLHPSAPRQYGAERRFARNGAAVDRITPNCETDDETVRAVCVGAKNDMSRIFAALQSATVDVTLDVYGDFPESVERTADECGLSRSVSFHGYCAHEEVIDGITRADVGFCLNPPQPDWYYAYPIRIGEYLAAGTVPISSPHRGVRELTREVGVLVSREPAAVADRLDELHDSERLGRRKHRAADRASEIAWRDERTWFARQVVET